MYDSLWNRSFICKKCPRKNQAPVFQWVHSNFMFNTATGNVCLVGEWKEVTLKNKSKESYIMPSNKMEFLLFNPFLFDLWFRNGRPPNNESLSGIIKWYVHIGSFFPRARGSPTEGRQVLEQQRHDTWQDAVPVQGVDMRLVHVSEQNGLNQYCSMYNSKVMQATSIISNFQVI